MPFIVLRNVSINHKLFVVFFMGNIRYAKNVFLIESIDLLKKYFPRFFLSKYSFHSLIQQIHTHNLFPIKIKLHHESFPPSFPKKSDTWSQKKYYSL